MSKLNIPLLIALTLGTSSATFGLPYRGTITQVITGSDDPLYHLGQTFIGHYQYNSPTMDGTFYTNQFDPPLTPKPPGAIAPLNGTIYSPFVESVYVTAYGGYTLSYGFGGSWRRLTDTINEGVLTVSDGVVKDFLWTWEKGGFYMHMGKDGFSTYSFYDTPASPTPTVRGTVTFGIPSRVPEKASSFWLLATALVPMVLISLQFPADRTVSKRAG